MAIVPVINSISSAIGTVQNGTTDSNDLTLTGTATVGSTVDVYDGSTLLGAATVNASGSWTFAADGLSDGANTFTATDTDSTGTSAASQATGVTVVPDITSFTTTPQSNFNIDGTAYNVQTAGKSYSMTEVDDHTLRFEIQAGDQAWFDAGSSVDRSEAQMDTRIPVGTPTTISYQFMLEPGATNTASWLVTAEMHNDDSALGSNIHTSPPFAIQLSGDHLQVVARYCPTGLDPSNGAGNVQMLTLWTDPNPIVRGQYNDIKIVDNIDNSVNGNGYLEVWINGTQVVNYHGPLGYGAPTYWEEGLYRSTTNQDLAADFRDLQITTGSTPPVTTPPVTTPPVTTQPAVTQATASPGTGVEAAGSTITLTLAFNEAVTVTGTPTLTLNDGNTATYVSGSGTGSLVFKTTVASTDTATSALAVTGVNLPSGASIKDSSGVAATLSAAATTFTGLQIDPTLPAVTKATASPGTGTEVVGNTVTMTLAFNEAVTVTGTPTLTLNDGNTATYVSGSGTGSLIFKTTVASTDTATSALAITGVNLPSGASIKDSLGVAANLSAAATTFTGLQIDPTLPAVTKATASPGTGTEVVGDTVTMTLTFNEAVTVAGMPSLALNDGDTALYASGSGTNTLTFRTTVASTDTNTAALAITGVNLPSGASIRDSSGVAANLSAAVTTFAGLQIDPPSSPPTAPTPPTSSPLPALTIADNALTVTKGGGAVGLGVNVSATDPSDAVTVNIRGLPRYETITDNLDGRTFSGRNVTLTEAEVDSGLTLHSYYHGTGTPVATLTLTATGKDSVTGTVATSAPQTITVTDPGQATATSAASTLANQGFALLNQHLAGHIGRFDSGQIVSAVSSGAGYVHDGVLTRPQH